jgi:hypothetical protein
MASDRNERQNQRDDSDETRIDSEDPVESADRDTPNPPRTTTRGGWTSPKFGSAGSGGAELEPGPRKN